MDFPAVEHAFFGASNFHLLGLRPFVVRMFLGVRSRVFVRDAACTFAALFPFGSIFFFFFGHSPQHLLIGFFLGGGGGFLGSSSVRFSTV